MVLPAEKLGKHKTAWQMVTVIYFLAAARALGIRARGRDSRRCYWWAHAWRYGGIALIALALGLTLYSGVGYLWKNRALIAAA